MQRTRQVHFLQNQFLEPFEDYSSDLNVAVTSQIHNRHFSHSVSGTGATTLISAGILILAIWSVTLIFKRDSIGRSNLAVQATVLAQPASQEGEVKGPPTSLVRSGPLGLYHWNPRCPLENARSRRSHSAKRVTCTRNRLTRREAELKSLRACPYCQEIGYWQMVKTQDDHSNHR